MRPHLAAWLLAATLPLGAQSPTPSPSAASFPDEPYLVTKALTSITLGADATSTRLITFAVLVRSDAALRQFGVVTVGFASRSEHVDLLYVRVTHPDGRTEDTPVADAVDQPAPVTREAPSYSDLRSKELPVKGLHLGDTLEWQARSIVDHPEVPGQAWGQDTFLRGVVSLNETYELRAPASLHVTAWTNPSLPGSFTETTEGSTKLYRWHDAALRPTVGPAADAFTKAEETRKRTPAEELDLTKGALPSLQWSTFPDWAAVGAWYRDLSTDRTAPDPAIRAKVAELTAGKATELEKAQAVYNFVSGQIRYIGVSFGIGRYQPHTAAEVFSNQYGDCKDKHTLLASMLSVLNLHADPVLIGAGIRFNPDVPSPAAFNHLITRLSLGGDTLLLDSTAEVGPWRALLQPIRDQHALLIPPTVPATLIVTPQSLPFPSFNTFSVVGSLDHDLTSDSKVVLTLRGDDEIYIRAVLRNVSPSSYGAFVQRFMTGMGFGGTTSDPGFLHLDDPSQPLQLSFHYHRVKEKDWGDNRITATFEEFGLASFTDDHPPVVAIQLGTPRTVTSTLEMQLPSGWTAQLPESVHAHSSYATCDVTYHLDHGKLFAERRLAILKEEVPLADYHQYQAWYDSSGAASVPYVQLFPPPKPVTSASLPVSKPPLASGTATVPDHPSDPRAASLIAKAIESVRSMDLDTARKDLDEAKSISPTEPELWAAYATVAALLGAPNDALDDMQHELSYHPQETRYYGPLAQAQVQNHDPEAALATLRTWVRIAPTDHDAALRLCQQLHASRRYADALGEAQSAIARIGPDGSGLAQLHLVAAEAQIALSHPKEAAAEILPLLKTAMDPDTRNGIAYVLAEANSHLDDAYTTQVGVLTTVEAETASWTLSEDSPRVVRPQSTLAADWDTMGWILYRQGRLADAFAYIGAALRTMDASAIRDHYAVIATGLNTPSSLAAAHRSDQQLRTFPLGAAGGRHGVSGFTLLLADGKLLDASAIDRDPSSAPPLPGAESLLKTTDFHALFPPGSKARLLRKGFVNCHSETCELILSPLNAQ